MRDNRFRTDLALDLDFRLAQKHRQSQQEDQLKQQGNRYENQSFVREFEIDALQIQKKSPCLFLLELVEEAIEVIVGYRLVVIAAFVA